MRRPTAPLILVTMLAGAAPARAQTLLFDQLEIVAPAAPGGGWDQTARAMQVALQAAGIARTATVENIPGAAGTIGLARFIGAERGNGRAVMASGLIMLGAIVTHRSPVTLEDVTPIARLTGEYEAVVVASGSPYRSLADLMQAFVARPESISWGGGSAGGTDQILAGLIAEAAGVDPRRVNYIAFSGGGESLSAIVGGQVDAGINGLAEFAAQIDAGTVRVLGVSSRERLPGVKAPTLRESGIDVELENWRSVVAPPGISDADRARLEAAMAAMVRSPAWQAALTRYRWNDRFLAGEAFAAFSREQEGRVRAILARLGTGRDDTSRRAALEPYPLLVLAGLAVCLAAAFPVAWRESRGADRRPNRTGWRALSWVAAGVAIDIALAERAGFVVASAALFWCCARAFDPRHPLRDAGFAAAVSLAVYLLFARALQLPLPAGVLARWL